MRLAFWKRKPAPPLHLPVYTPNDDPSHSDAMAAQMFLAIASDGTTPPPSLSDFLESTCGSTAEFVSHTDELVVQVGPSGVEVWCSRVEAERIASLIGGCAVGVYLPGDKCKFKIVVKNNRISPTIAQLSGRLVGAQ